MSSFMESELSARWGFENLAMFGSKVSEIGCDRWTKEISYAEYYGRALTNGVLSIQIGRDPGRMIYMLPLHPAGSKARSYHSWGSQFNDFWFCYGTGIESFSKLGDSIYFEEEGSNPTIHIIQYVSSSLDWKSRNVLLIQDVEPVVSWDPLLKVAITPQSRKLENLQKSEDAIMDKFKRSKDSPEQSTFSLIGTRKIPSDLENLELW